MNRTATHEKPAVRWKHMYTVQLVLETGVRGEVYIEANNRDQAARFAKKEVPTSSVCSVNMVG